MALSPASGPSVWRRPGGALTAYAGGSGPHPIRVVRSESSDPSHPIRVVRSESSDPSHLIPVVLSESSYPSRPIRVVFDLRVVGSRFPGGPGPARGYPTARRGRPPPAGCVGGTWTGICRLRGEPRSPRRLSRRAINAFHPPLPPPPASWGSRVSPKSRRAPRLGRP